MGCSYYGERSPKAARSGCTTTHTGQHSEAQTERTEEKPATTNTGTATPPSEIMPMEYDNPPHARPLILITPEGDTTNPSHEPTTATPVSGLQRRQGSVEKKICETRYVPSSGREKRTKSREPHRHRQIECAEQRYHSDTGWHHLRHHPSAHRPGDSGRPLPPGVIGLVLRTRGSARIRPTWARSEHGIPKPRLRQGGTRHALRGSAWVQSERLPFLGPQTGIRCCS